MGVAPVVGVPVGAQEPNFALTVGGEAEIFASFRKSPVAVNLGLVGGAFAQLADPSARSAGYLAGRAVLRWPTQSIASFELGAVVGYQWVERIDRPETYSLSPIVASAMLARFEIGAVVAITDQLGVHLRVGPAVSGYDHLGTTETSLMWISNSLAFTYTFAPDNEEVW